VGYEIDFLPVGDSNGDAICIRYGKPDSFFIHVTDGAFKDTGESIIKHIETFYGNNVYINNMVLSHACNDHAPGLIPVSVALRQGNARQLPWSLYPPGSHRRHEGQTPVSRRARTAGGQEGHAGQRCFSRRVDRQFHAGLFGKAKPNDRSAPESLRTGPGSFRGIGIGKQGLQALTFELFVINDVVCRAIQTRVAPEDRKRDDAPPDRQHPDGNQNDAAQSGIEPLS
jgi:hypothetical protein